MTAEEIFCNLFDKYGEDFNWYMVPLSQSNGVRAGRRYLLYFSSDLFKAEFRGVS